jgi:cysteine desulfurase
MTTRRTVYLDHNATTPVRPEVLEAMMPFLTEEYGNASSLHAKGRLARDAVERARESVARLIGASPSEIVFTSGGTESVNSAIRGVFDAPAPRDRRRFVTSAVEHQAVMESARGLEQRGFAVTAVGVDRYGRVEPDAVRRVLDESVRLVSIMHGNNEVGTMEPVAEVAALAREVGALVHTDAVQTVGKIPVLVSALGVDLLSLSGHKIGAPKGIGALYVRRGVRLEPLIVGGSQERNRRGGTENVPAIVALGKAAELAATTLHEASARLRGLTERFVSTLRRRVDGVTVNSPGERLPGTISLAFEGANGESLVLALDLDGICVSTGSACASGSMEPSHVLAAMGLSPARARGTIRFSFGYGNDEGDIEKTATALERILARSRHRTSALLTA